MSMRKMLEDEIRSEFEVLKDAEVGTDAYKSTIDGVTKLMDRAIEMEKLDIESRDKFDTREDEKQLRLQQMKEDKKDRWVKNGISGFSAIAGIGVAIWGTIVSMNFEKEGIITTTAGKKHINKLFSWFK